MQPDCLYHGYVLIGYPNTKEEMDFLMKTIIAPNRFRNANDFFCSVSFQMTFHKKNRIIFLHAGINLCYRRKFNQICNFIKQGMSSESVRHGLKIIQEDIRRYNQKIPEFIQIYGKRDGLCHVNANRSLINVRKEIFSFMSI